MRAEWVHFIELLTVMTEKELRARYKHTVFGFFWLVANPILQMVVIGFVFQFFIKEPIRYYLFHLFSGLLVWNFFSLSLTKATPSIVYERSLIKKANFSRSVIPLSIVLANLVHLFVAFGLFMIPVVFLQTLTITGVLIALFALILLTVFTFGISLLTSALNVRFRDINFFTQAILIIWFYASPIVYSLDHIPAHMLWLWRFNPMTSILQFLQYGLLKAAPPGPFMTISNIVSIIVIAVAGVFVFRYESKNFDDWV